MKILTLTLNLAVDQTINLKKLLPGQVNRADSVYLNAGGKGLNVSSCLADWGIKSNAGGILGTENATLFESLCAQKDIGNKFVLARGENRINIKLVDNHSTTDINLPGLHVDEKILSRVESVLVEHSDADIFVFSGSLPEGCPTDIYTRFIKKLDRQSNKIILDTSGDALKTTLDSSIYPYCIKPNLQELCELTKKTPLSTEDVATQAHQFLNKELKLMVISLGQKGAIFMNHTQILLAVEPTNLIISTVGAGDAMVAGIVASIAEGANLERTARLSTAFSIGRLGQQGANLPEHAEIEALAREVSIKTLNI